MLAVYWITRFSTQYAENRDAIFVSMKTFNNHPSDKYPIFTLCFKGDRFHWFHDDNIFMSYNLNPTQYELMLKGEKALKDEFDMESKLYIKKQVFFNDGNNVNLNQNHLKMTDFLSEIVYTSEIKENDAYFKSNQDKNSSAKAQMILSYQMADRICFSRPSSDPLNLIRVQDLIGFNSSVIKWYKDTELQVFIHSPNQLIRSFDKPKYEAKFEYLMSTLDGPKAPKLLEFTISQVKQLRKRSDSNTPCSKQVEDYDKFYQGQISQKLGCVPPYWNIDNGLEQCTTPKKLQEAHRILSDPKSILELQDFPCNEMLLLSIVSINDEPTPRLNDISLAFFYPDKTYEEIQYSRMMGFDGWLSNVGGFIGIFLGCSLMQIPDVLVFIIGLVQHQKVKNIYGN